MTLCITLSDSLMSFAIGKIYAESWIVPTIKEIYSVDEISDEGGHCFSSQCIPRRRLYKHFRCFYALGLLDRKLPLLKSEIGKNFICCSKKELNTTWQD